MDPQLGQQIETLIKTNKSTDLDNLLTLNPDFPIDTEYIEWRKRTPLLFAVQCAHPKCVAVLLSHKASIAITTSPYNITICALTWACSDYKYCKIHENKPKYKNIIKQLITAGADCNYRLNFGYTALMYVCGHYFMQTDTDIDDCVELVKLLLDNGADRELINENGKTAIDLAQDYARTTNSYVIANLVRDYQPVPFPDTKWVVQDDI